MFFMSFICKLTSLTSMGQLLNEPESLTELISGPMIRGTSYYRTKTCAVIVAKHDSARPSNNCFWTS